MDDLLPPSLAERYAGWMDRALELARMAPDTGDVPVGAVLVDESGVTWGQGVNRREADGDPLAHAELLAVRDAARSRSGWRLDGLTVVVTLEPCAMCAGALAQARVGRIVFGAWDPKAGACGSVWDLVRDRRTPTWIEVVGGIREQECAAELTAFFGRRRS